MARKKIKKNRFISTTALIVILLFSVVAGIGCWATDGFGMFATHDQKSVQVDAKDARNPIIQEMTKKPGDWKKVERDFSSLSADMANNEVAAIGIIDDGLLVSTSKNERYVIYDQYKGISLLFLKDYAQKDLKPFPLSYIRSGFSAIAGSPNSFANALIQGLLFPLLLIGLIIGAYYLYLRISNFHTLQDAVDVRFTDVIGAQDAKTSFIDVVSYLKAPERYAAIGAKPPKGILLDGPPGVGKTLLAKALAGECGVNFISITGGDFSSKFYGVGIQRVKSLFRTARKHAPCIIFIDEADGLGTRVEQSNSVDAESNRIINQILTEMDGFHAADGVIVIGATNFAGSIDPALTREGRFDRKITVNLPGVDDRKNIFDFYLKKVKVGTGIDSDQLARLTVGLSPATISYVVTHAAFLAAKNNRSEVTMSDILEAIDTHRMGGAEGSTVIMTDEEKMRIAYHEAGHAIVACCLNLGVVEKVTILPRGQALGVTVVTPERDKSLHLKHEIESRIKMLLAGRCAELTKCGGVSSGASSDLKEASRLAFNMVAQLGMSDKGDLFSIEALRDFRLTPNQDIYVAEANKVLSRLDLDCQALLAKLDVALETVTHELIQHETIEGSVVVNAVNLVMADKKASEGTGK